MHFLFMIPLFCSYHGKHYRRIGSGVEHTRGSSTAAHSSQSLMEHLQFVSHNGGLSCSAIPAPACEGTEWKVFELMFVV